MPFRIYPPIGIARVGNSLSQFYIGPEIPGHPGFEPNGLGTESVVKQYKVDEDEIKRQAARFRVFEVPDGGAPRPAQFPPGTVVEWTVHLVNKKAAVIRSSLPPGEAQRPQLAAGSAARVIDSQQRRIAGANAAGVKLDTGEFMTRRVPLGELLTDSSQNLLVLGGHGFSSSPLNAPLPSFYTNPGWHDDVSDGPVRARVQLPDGSTVDDVAPAWVVVAPPDFAPDIQGIVTLYDVIWQVGIAHFGLQPPGAVSFTRHVFPLLQRARRLRWVHGNKNWQSISDDWAGLSDPSAAAAPLRIENAKLVRNVVPLLTDHELTDLQEHFLDRWETGNFTSDWTGIPQIPQTLTAEGMTRAALEATVGRGFYPGIEAGIIVTDPTLYSTPFDFRFDHAQAAPGDITALMAVPWQADFYNCQRSWWPSQRPDDVRPDAGTAKSERWERGVESRIGMVNNFSKLAFITAQMDDQGNIVFAEDQRALISQFV